MFHGLFRGWNAAGLASNVNIMQVHEGNLANESMEEIAAARRDVGARPRSGRSRGTYPELFMTRVVAVMSHVAELGVFFAAAAALGAGLMSLR